MTAAGFVVEHSHKFILVSVSGSDAVEFTEVHPSRSAHCSRQVSILGSASTNMINIRSAEARRKGVYKKYFHSSQTVHRRE